MGSIKTFITVDGDIPALNHQTGLDLIDLFVYGFDCFEVFNPSEPQYEKGRSMLSIPPAPVSRCGVSREKTRLQLVPRHYLSETYADNLE